MVPALPRFAYVYSVLINFEQFLESTSLLYLLDVYKGIVHFRSGGGILGFAYVYNVFVHFDQFGVRAGGFPGQPHILLNTLAFPTFLMKSVFCIRVQRF